MNQIKGGRWHSAWPIAATLTSLWLFGCGGPADNSATTDKGMPKNKGTRIVLVTNSNSDWWSAVEKGMKDAGAKFSSDVEMKRGDGTTDKQIKLIEEAANTSDVGAVAVSVLEPDAPGIADAMKKVKDAGKHLITIDSDIAPSSAELRRAYIGTNNTSAGEAAGKAAAQLRPQGGTVAVFVGSASAANAKERLDGFYVGAGDKFQKPPAKVFEDSADMNTAQRYANIAVNTLPDLGVMLGLYSYNAPRLAEEASKSPDFRKKTTIVTFDLDEQAVEFLEKGQIDVSVCQNPYEIGYQGVQLLKALIADDKKAVDEMLPAGATTKDTGVRVIVPTEESPVKGANVITIKAMKEWLASKGLKSS